MWDAARDEVENPVEQEDEYLPEYYCITHSGFKALDGNLIPRLGLGKEVKEESCSDLKALTLGSRDRQKTSSPRGNTAITTVVPLYVQRDKLQGDSTAVYAK